MEKKCLDCGRPISGRADKKFCDDGCRGNYNNKRYSEDNNYLRRVNSILKRNRKILEVLTTDGRTKVTWKTLMREGFNFEYITEMYETGKGLQYRFCYEYGYLLLEDGEVLLVKRKN